jgi:hypothetical protein
MTQVAREPRWMRPDRALRQVSERRDERLGTPPAEGPERRVMFSLRRADREVRRTRARMREHWKPA